jgi:hypothetical protein
LHTIFPVLYTFCLRPVSKADAKGLGTTICPFADAVNDLQRLKDQSDLAGLGPEDLYVMRYLTMTDDPDLLDKLLEI